MHTTEDKHSSMPTSWAQAVQPGHYLFSPATQQFTQFCSELQRSSLGYIARLTCSACSFVAASSCMGWFPLRRDCIEPIISFLSSRISRWIFHHVELGDWGYPYATWVWWPGLADHEGTADPLGGGGRGRLLARGHHGCLLVGDDRLGDVHQPGQRHQCGIVADMQHH